MAEKESFIKYLFTRKLFYVFLLIFLFISIDDLFVSSMRTMVHFFSILFRIIVFSIIIIIYYVSYRRKFKLT